MRKKKGESGPVVPTFALRVMTASITFVADR
jgi:hypothetical protein